MSRTKKSLQLRAVNTVFTLQEPAINEPVYQHIIITACKSFSHTPDDITKRNFQRLLHAYVFFQQFIKVDGNSGIN